MLRPLFIQEVCNSHKGICQGYGKIGEAGKEGILTIGWVNTGLQKVNLITVDTSLK